MITLLMALFMVLFSISSVNISKYQTLQESLKAAFSGSILSGGSAILQSGSESTSAHTPATAEVPSIVTGRVMAGSDWRPTRIVPSTLKSIVSGPGCWLAAMIAWRSDPGPASAVLLTRNVESKVRSSIHSTRGRSRKSVPLNTQGGTVRRERRPHEFARVKAPIACAAHNPGPVLL